MTFDQADAELQDYDKEDITPETIERALDAIAFVQSLHEMFKANGMTQAEEPNVDELENIIDAVNGELGAAVLFLCEPSFARVPDMMRVIAKQIPSMSPDVPPVIVKGFERVAKRIENTRVNMQALVKVSTDAKQPA